MAKSPEEMAKTMIANMKEKTGKTLCLVDVPARYKTITKQVIKEKASIEKVAVPAKIKTMRMSKLVEADRKNGLAVYRLIEPHLPSLLHCMDRCCDDRN